MRRFVRKPLFALLMVLLTLGAVEAMAWLVRSLVYGENAGRLADVSRSKWERYTRRGYASHPFYGLVSWEHYLPPRPEGVEGALVVALLGASVAHDVAHDFRSALSYHTSDLDTGVSPLVFVDLAHGGNRQPLQALAFANMLASGMRFDVVVVLDGLNEIVQPQEMLDQGVAFPVYPKSWAFVAGMTVDERIAAGRILALRDEQEYLREREGGIYGSVAFDLLRRFRLDRTGHLIVRRHRELARAGTAHHNLEKHGSRRTYTAEELREIAADTWYRGALLLARLAKRHGAEYYHFLQPNQYVPGAKPLTDEERAKAFAPDGKRAEVVRQDYPLLAERGRRLRERGVEFFDLSRIFADNHETLYRDICCHLNQRGNELLAGHMLRRILGQAVPVDGANHATNRTVPRRLQCGDRHQRVAGS